MGYAASCGCGSSRRIVARSFDMVARTDFVLYLENLALAINLDFPDHVLKCAWN